MSSRCRELQPGQQTRQQYQHRVIVTATNLLNWRAPSSVGNHRTPASFPVATTTSFSGRQFVISPSSTTLRPPSRVESVHRHINLNNTHPIDQAQLKYLGMCHPAHPTTHGRESRLPAAPGVILSNTAANTSSPNHVTQHLLPVHPPLIQIAHSLACTTLLLSHFAPVLCKYTALLRSSFLHLPYHSLRESLTFIFGALIRSSLKAFVFPPPHALFCQLTTAATPHSLVSPPPSHIHLRFFLSSETQHPIAGYHSYDFLLT